MRFDRMITNARLATMVGGDAPYGKVDADAIGIINEKIAWIGSTADNSHEAASVDDVEGRWVTPALIDCHTHLVFAGDRVNRASRYQ